MDKNELRIKYINMLKKIKPELDPKTGFYEGEERWGPEKSDFIKGFFDSDQSWWDKTNETIFEPEFKENYALAFLIGSSRVLLQVPEYSDRVKTLIEKIIPKSKIFTEVFKEFNKATNKDKYEIGFAIASISGFKRKLHGTVEQWY